MAATDSGVGIFPKIPVISAWWRHRIRRASLRDRGRRPPQPRFDDVPNRERRKRPVAEFRTRHAPVSTTARGSWNWFAMARDADDRSGREDEMRSEEHTSELQSPMY